MTQATKPIVAAYDFSEYGDGALREALRCAHEEVVPLYVVRVLTRQELDATGKLSLEAKRAAALDGLHRRIYGRIETHALQLLGEIGLATMEIQVEVRFAEAHLARSEEHTAGAIMHVAADFEAGTIYIGRRGRPGSVAEHLLQRCAVLEEGDGYIQLSAPDDVVREQSASWQSTGIGAPSRGEPLARPGPWRDK